MRRVLYLAWFALYLLHNDLWLWEDRTLIASLPVGFLYHIGFCVASSVMLALLVNFAWPRHLDDEEEADQ